MAYTGHCHDLGFGMSNFQLSACPAREGTYDLRLDNTDPQHEFYGPWREYRDSLAYGNNTFHYKRRGAGEEYFRYLTPDGSALETARYRVYARWPAKSVAASNTKYRVYPGDGYTDVRVDQTQNSARWFLLGTWDITHPRPVIRVYDDADGYVVADGIRLVRVGPVQATAERAGALPENSDEIDSDDLD
jgi:hypothetical protein